MVDPLLGFLFLVGLAIAVWFGATVRAPYAQKDEARAALRLSNLNRDSLEEDIASLRISMSKLNAEIDDIKKHRDALEQENEQLIEALKNECPIWIHEASGATVIGKDGRSIQVQGGVFPYGIKVNGPHIMITGISAGR